MSIVLLVGNNKPQKGDERVAYYMYIESACAFEAESEEDARRQAVTWYIEQLQKGEIEILVEEEE